MTTEPTAAERLDVLLWRPAGYKWAFLGQDGKPAGSYDTWKDAQDAARRHYRPRTVHVWTIQFCKNHDNE